jgi:hypothetical protein
MNAYTDIHALSGFEPTIPAFERAKTVQALEREATVICSMKKYQYLIPEDGGTAV